MAGIPSKQLKVLRQLLLRCEQFFVSNEILRDLFTDERIAPWRNGLPERGSIDGRIEATIAHLNGKQRKDGRYALPLLLHVISDLIDSDDLRHPDLVQMAHQLEGVTPGATKITQPAWNHAIIRQLLREALGDQQITDLTFDHFRPVHEEFAMGMARSQKIQLLLDYCERTNQIEALLTQIKKINPHKYRQYESDLRA
jgi:hypothetical protein